MQELLSISNTKEPQIELLLFCSFPQRFNPLHCLKEAETVSKRFALFHMIC